MFRYAVMRDGAKIGTVVADNYSQATRKAMYLYKRHIYVERMAA